ncbi:MAG: hypothetical protein UX86_C0020G0011 [Candidatus Amesbacteria bacterium GW2011_GWC1_47_15]|uniref:Uncharacterized protein n=2 Tax=Candidatus Amesiibacteriota TaxID=1752730 RepID=A0A0G1V111_9BACT|nr:MAG: hypothetical protein UX86_C0020G0011 [Candidatus Amesbacteria bacterium GW2011_GWC1_47_15]KKU96661.1 MAG: hypothetical protein UY28_C0031G0005 [Candidatus Amesbacteria bacterium GW2011_GWB1_48_13]
MYDGEEADRAFLWMLGRIFSLTDEELDREVRKLIIKGVGDKKEWGILPKRKTIEIYIKKAEDAGATAEEARVNAQFLRSQIAICMSEAIIEGGLEGVRRLKAEYLEINEKDNRGELKEIQEAFEREQKQEWRKRLEF